MEYKLSKRERKKKKRMCCVKYCINKNLRIFYCGNCKKSYQICKKDFKGRSRNKNCPVCKTSSILRKWSIPI